MYVQRKSVEVIVYLEIFIERLERGAIFIETQDSLDPAKPSWLWLEISVQHVFRLQTSRHFGEGSFLGQGIFVT